MQRCRAIVCFGADAAKFDDAVAAALREISERDFSTARVRTLAEAVETAAQLAQPGDVVLLSPAGTSFDSYANFEQRGDEFRALVHTMKTEAR